MAAPIPAEDTSHEIAFVARLSCWRGRVDIAPLSGGLSNRNYRVADAGGRYVVRLGEDVPEHGLVRRNEEISSRAAAASGISPDLVHAEPGALVFRFVEGRTLKPEDLRVDAVLSRVLELVQRAHRAIPGHLAGGKPYFRVFQVLRWYASTLARGESRWTGDLPRLMAAAEDLERAAGPGEDVFAHNDLLAANLIDDGKRLWLIDWEYGGFNSPLFDLGNLASNNGLAPAQSEGLLAAYDWRAPDARRKRAFAAFTAASLLREAMWSMVQEIHSRLKIDYPAYTEENLARFDAAWTEFRENEAR
jgi:thiamine kinase-like enzyme